MLDTFQSLEISLEASFDVIYIPAYHSGFSGIITEKHIKLRYYGEGEIIPEFF